MLLLIDKILDGLFILHGEFDLQTCTAKLYPQDEYLYKVPGVVKALLMVKEHAKIHGPCKIHCPNIAWPDLAFPFESRHIAEFPDHNGELYPALILKNWVVVEHKGPMQMKAITPASPFCSEDLLKVSLEPR
jgi:hypothetical protein